MNLVASVIVHNELERYLQVTIPHLLTFCEEVAVLDDYSTDGSWDYLDDLEGVSLKRNSGPSFFEHEGKARQALLDWTLGGNPSHILAIDADEIVTDPVALRTLTGSRNGVWTLVMEEVWKADENTYAVRQDGGWRAHPIGCLYAVGPRIGQIRDVALACGREPTGVLRRRAIPSHSSILHLGWANESERDRRYERYAVHDGGRFHRSAHLESILWPDEKVTLERRPWPEALRSEVPALLERIERDVS
jgi:hypothetical protein